MLSKEQQHPNPDWTERLVKPVALDHFKLQQWLREIFAYSADSRVATIPSSVASGRPKGPEYSSCNQSAVANLLHEGYLKISPDFSAAASDEVHPAPDLEFIISLTIVTGEVYSCRFRAVGREIARSSSEQKLGATGEFPNTVVFTVRFMTTEDQQIFLNSVSQFGFEVADDVAFTDSLTLYLNINYLKHLQPQPAVNQRLHWI